MSRLPVVAVVGRPNVGKSTLVNRIVGRREAVVEERPGVTRDRTTHEAEWEGRRFLVVDTGGWEIHGDELTAGIRSQAEVAVSGADVVLFVADARTTVTEDDAAVARLIQRSGVPAVLVANKVDGPRHELEVGELWALGLDEPVPISALHGRNTGELLDRVVELLPEEPDGTELEDEHAPATVAIIGRPNVGKSTLLNRLAGEERVLVSPTPGTTRDAVDETIELDGTTYRLVDTAGIRRAARVERGTEYFSVVRARQAMERADVVLLVIDAVAGVTHQEQRLAEEIADSGAGLIVLLNKWDAVEEEERLRTEDGVADRLAFVSWAPVLRVSALSGARLHRLGAAVEMVLENRRARIPTPELNRKIRAWQEAHPAPIARGRRPRVIYAVQAGEDPPTFILFMRGGEPGPDYLRFLENRIRGDYDFTGTPVRLIARVRSNADV